MVKVVFFFLFMLMSTYGEESSGEEPTMGPATSFDEDMLLTILSAAYLDPTIQGNSSSNSTKASESPESLGVITSTQEILEVSSGEHPLIKSEEKLTESYFVSTETSTASTPYQNASATFGNGTISTRHQNIFFEQSWIPILFLLFGICLPLLTLCIFMLCLCYKHRKTSNNPNNLSYLWRSEGGSDYSEALSTPDSPSGVFVGSDTSACYIPMNLNNNVIRSGRVYPSLSGNSAVDAVRRGDLEEVHQLMFMNASLKGEKDLNGWSVLHIAIYNHDVPMLKVLVEGVRLGLVNLFERNNDGQSPIVFAASLCNNQLDCVALLTDALSDIRNCGVSQEGQYAVKKLLPLSGENINEWALVDDLGRNVIHYAALNNSPQAIHLFYSTGADINYIDFRGDSPLHLATREGHGPAVQALLDCGVNTRIKNADGIEPIALAENRNFSVLADKLRRASIHKTSGKTKTQRRKSTSLSTTDSARGSCDSWVFHHNSFRSECGSKRSSLSFSSDVGDLERGQSFTYIPGYDIGSPSEEFMKSDDSGYGSRKRKFLQPLACDTYDEFFTDSAALAALPNPETESPDLPSLQIDENEMNTHINSLSALQKINFRPFKRQENNDHTVLDRERQTFSSKMHTFKSSSADEN